MPRKDPLGNNAPKTWWGMNTSDFILDDFFKKSTTVYQQFECVMKQQLKRHLSEQNKILSSRDLDTTRKFCH